MPPKPRSSGYLPSLDGWRAIAIAGVIMSHDAPWSIAGHSNVLFKGVGGYGVYLFFALSGILICWRILEDEATTGAFRLKSFYIRRLCRIQPAALAYLTVVAVLMLAGLVHERWHFWFGALFLYQNFLFHAADWTLIMAGYLTGHFWTLSVEEHFYILLSLFLVTVRRYRVLGMALLLVVLVAARLYAHRHGLYSGDTSTRRSYWIMPALLYPSLLALMLRRPGVYSVACKYLTPWAIFTFTGVLLFGYYTARHGLHGFFTQENINGEIDHCILLFPFWLVASMLHAKSWTTRFLELPLMRYLGRLSYSIYVWHLIAFVGGEPDTHVTWAPLLFIGQRPWRYIVTVLLAIASYHWIEKPMIRLGHRLAPPATAGHQDLATPEIAAQPEPRLPDGELLR